MEERTNTSNTKGLVIAASLVIVVGLVVVLSGRGGNSDTVVPVPTATSSAPTAEDIFAMEPIVPEAKVSTEGWKTCRNDEYGYEFKFPAEWHIYGEDALGEPIGGKRYFVRESEECNGESVHLAPLSADKLDFCASDSGCISITLHVLKVPTTPGLYWKNLLDAQNAINYRQRNPVLINPTTGLLLVTSNIFLYWQAIAINSGNVYTVSGFQYDANQATIETIISTFRLFDASSITSRT